jgi:hypothetical protein
MDNTIHNIIKMKHIINTLQLRGCKQDTTTNRIVKRRDIDTERIEVSMNRVVEKTGGSRVAAIQISQFLSISIIHIDNNIVI